ncbi:hypothetical protein PLICRDRAFT_117547 [Plicaturopsis crispa FD-325 SS-3]|uniref:Uncharacterized protein n=1 Tax=Plicaturopsis crispa FD-325 SS-3 TaxID=944288 RepID=A0A0C9SXP0_PLICR|nr:hypothetical protein PLICRDRAFT_117547 [Plicaturopsis crispa FD-325 SS-3]
MTWLNFLLVPYTAKHAIIPQTQVATQKGVQTRDVMGYLAGIKCYAERHKQPVYALQRDQMKGFDYLSPDGFYDAIRAYGLPASIIELDKAAQSNTVCTPRTAFGPAQSIIVDGLTKQGGAMSPVKATLTTSLGHRYLDDLAMSDPGTLVMRSHNAEKGVTHQPSDRVCVRATMVEATDDSYLFATTLPTLQKFCLEMERFHAYVVDDPGTRFQGLQDFIRKFVFPKFAVRTPITLMAKITQQNIISRCRALLSIQPIKQSDAATLDRQIAAKVHALSGFPYAPNTAILTLPISMHGIGFPSVARINAGICIEGIARDLNHHIPAYRDMARLTLADWTCSINGCVFPLDGTGLNRDFSHYHKRLPAAWIVAQKLMSSLSPKLSLRLTDASHIYRGEVSLAHACNILSEIRRLPVPNGHALRSLSTKGVQHLKDVGSWTVICKLPPSSRNCNKRLWASDGSMQPASSGIGDKKSITAAVTGAKTLTLKVVGRNASIMHGELMGLIAGLILSNTEDESSCLFSDHLNSVRFVEDVRSSIDQESRMRNMNGRGHSQDTDIASLLNNDADHFAVSSQRAISTTPIAPIPTFTMDEFTFYRENDGWIESNIRAFIDYFLARAASENLAIGHRQRMATWLYDPRPPPLYPYTRATAAYSALVQLYARSGQLATAEGLKQKGQGSDDGCRYGCNAIEDPYHIFVECRRFEALRREATEGVEKRTKARILDKGLEEARFASLLAAAKLLFSDSVDIWPLQYSAYYLGHVPPLDGHVPPDAFDDRLTRERFLHNVHADWHLAAVRLASRIFGTVQREMAKRAGFEEGRGGKYRRR